MNQQGARNEHAALGLAKGHGIGVYSAANRLTVLLDGWANHVVCVIQQLQRINVQAHHSKPGCSRVEIDLKTVTK